jgi:hypothetical protein
MNSCFFPSKRQPMNSEWHACFRARAACMGASFWSQALPPRAASCHYMDWPVRLLHPYSSSSWTRTHTVADTEDTPNKSPVRRTWSRDPRTHRRGRSMCIHIWTRLTDLKLEARTVYGVATRRTPLFDRSVHSCQARSLGSDRSARK